MLTAVKCVKQHSYEVEQLEELKEIATRYVAVKNYVYSRYSGINSLMLLSKARKGIRDEWVATKFADQWGLPARYWKMALDEAIANIKTNWTSTKKKVKLAVSRNENLTDAEKHFILYVIKSDSLLHSILSYTPIDKPKKIQTLEIREKYVFNIIRRYVRKYKGRVPYASNTKGFMLDADMYKYEDTEKGLYLHIMGLKRGKRIPIRLKDSNIHKGNIRVLLRCSTVEIHRVKNVKTKQLWQEEKAVGVDKGYRTLITTSEGKFYGAGLNEMLSKETERLNKVNAERNKFYALYKKYQTEGKTLKAENILKYNLGKQKYIRNKTRYDTQVKSYINQELNRFFREAKPSEVITEDLTFVSWKDRYPKHVKRKLSRWLKGYLRERLEYKALLWRVKVTQVNAAYTSQVCSKCGVFGKRSGDVFECNHCGKSHADVNASINILRRRDEEDIKLYTSYKEVKKLLEARLKVV
jgi:IS605 OrfB family transposase